MYNFLLPLFYITKFTLLHFNNLAPSLTTIKESHLLTKSVKFRIIFP